MKKTEKLIASLLTVVFGILLIVLKGSIISILMTVLGVGLIVLGIMDLQSKLMPSAVIKLVFGFVVVICGWVIVSAVLYILAALLLVTGILLLYEKIKNRFLCTTLWQTVCEYAVPVVLLIIGALLLFNQGGTVDWVFIVSGIFTVIQGGLLLVNVISNDY